MDRKIDISEAYETATQNDADTGSQLMPLYPLTFQTIYLPKVWGGSHFASILGRDLPISEPIGEAWELADLDETSTSGAGGGEARSIVANGPLQGRPLHDLMTEYQEELMGALQPDEANRFPILLKYLDARKNLSVQVHPSKDYADKHEDAYLKSEAWYVVHAEPDAVIYKGMKPGVTEEMFRKAIQDKTVDELLIKIPVKAGDCHYLPTGRCHALGEGIVMAEVQTPSDTTFRVYDWERTNRELHIEQAMQCLTFKPTITNQYQPNTVIEREHTKVESLVECEYFVLKRYTIAAGYQQQINPAPGPRVRMILEGTGQIQCQNAGHDQTPYTPFQTILLPALMDQAKTIVETDSVWLEISFPQTMADLIA